MKLAIIIPYRNRKEHLKAFLHFLPKKINVDDYLIIVVEQSDDKAFNRAKLINTGFNFIKDKVDYICFHDVDMIPVKADYSYSDIPLHMASNCSQFDYKLPYNNYYGGVNLMSNENFIKINGFSNDYWGWGVEDDDLLARVMKSGYGIKRRTGYYYSLPHKKNPSNRPENLKKYNSKYNYLEDGLSNLEYKLLEEVKLNDFTIKIKVEL
jgi:GT2 family glycosyltransferase